MPKAKAKWWVYILRCRDGTLYTGITTDPARRLEQHNAGTASKYTRSRRPVVMVRGERAKTHGDALRRELAIKKLSRIAKNALIAPPAQPGVRMHTGRGAGDKPRARKRA